MANHITICAACNKSGCNGDCKENKALNRKWAKLHAVKDIVHKNPGLDAIALKGKGFKPSSQCSLRDVEQAGLIEYRNGGWYEVAASLFVRRQR